MISKTKLKKMKLKENFKTHDWVILNDTKRRCKKCWTTRARLTDICNVSCSEVLMDQALK